LGGSVYRRGMDWQQVSALGIVAATAGIFAWRKLHRRKVMFGADGHCGCGGKTSPAEKGSIVFRARKGERPQVIVKPK
jgi:hypothetical protein